VLTIEVFHDPFFVAGQKPIAVTFGATTFIPSA
jgi:hypothetical protein